MILVFPEQQNIILVSSGNVPTFHTHSGAFLSIDKRAFTSNDDAGQCLATSLVCCDKANKKKNFMLWVANTFIQSTKHFSCLLCRDETDHWHRFKGTAAVSNSMKV
jgi:hypothetical protein